MELAQNNMETSDPQKATGSGSANEKDSKLPKYSDVVDDLVYNRLVYSKKVAECYSKITELELQKLKNTKYRELQATIPDFPESLKFPIKNESQTSDQADLLLDDSLFQKYEQLDDHIKRALEVVEIVRQ